MPTPKESLEELKTRVKAYLLDYLLEQNVLQDFGGEDYDPHSKFRCVFNDDHSDKHNPNCGIIDPENPIQYYCYACHVSGDIFTAANRLEAKPLSGKTFITENLYYLAEKFNIPFERDLRLSAEEVQDMENQHTHKAAAQILKDSGTLRLATARGWSEKTCKDLGIGSIPIKEMQRLLFDTTRLPSSKTEHLDGMLFGGHRLTFTIKNEHGHPVAFSARDTRWHAPRVQEDGTTLIYHYPKYTNSPNSVFKKRETLYNMDVAKRYKKLPLYVFEGYADAVTAYEKGIFNTVAVCGTALTPEHVQLIKKMGFTHIRLCFDSDKAGIQAIMKYLKESAKCFDLVVQIVVIPEGETKEESDPDSFIKREGKDAFLNLPALDAFEWMVNNVGEMSEEEICAEFIPFIASDPRPTRWNRRINMLADKTGIRQDLIMKEIMAIVNNEAGNAQIKKRDIVQNAHNEIIYNREDPVSVMSNAVKQLQDVDRNRGNHTTDVNAHLEAVNDIFLTWDERDPSRGLAGWRTGYPMFDRTFDGLPKRHCFMGVAALASMGKTSFIANLIIRILDDLECNENVTVVVITIDDSREQFMARLIGIETGIRSSNVMFPQKYLQASEQVDMVMAARNKIKRYMTDGRLVIFDSDYGTMYSQIIENVRQIKEKYRGREILAFLDNFHKVTDAVGKEDLRFKFRSISQRIKEDVVTDDFTMVATLELRKEAQGYKPLKNHVMETGQIEYDLNILGLGWNQIHDLRSTGANYFWFDERNPGTKLPIFEIEIAKNKVTGVEADLYYRLDQYSGRMWEATQSEVETYPERYVGDVTQRTI